MLNFRQEVGLEVGWRLQAYDDGPMGPRPLHPILWFKPTPNGRLRRIVEQLPWISDVVGPLGTLGGVLVGLASVACGPLAPLPRPLALFVHFVTSLHKF